MDDTDKAREVAITVHTHTEGGAPAAIEVIQRQDEATWDVTCFSRENKMTRYVVTHEWVIKPVVNA